MNCYRQVTIKCSYLQKLKQTLGLRICCLKVKAESARKVIPGLISKEVRILST
jgi:hypothetical protein